MKQANNYFFHTYISGCSNMKVQNTFLKKFLTVKLKIDAFIFSMIFFKVLYQKIYESILVYNLSGQPSFLGIRAL